jgi:hypothetical protein
MKHIWSFKTKRGKSFSKKGGTAEKLNLRPCKFITIQMDGDF